MNKAEPVNPIPNVIPSVDKDLGVMLPLLMQEWETVIKSQMHFNDLIIRYRTIILTGFATLLGAAETVIQRYSVTKNILWLLLILLIAGFVLDFFYYHRLLLGAVAQSKKFDNSGVAKQFGLFGMTECIKNHVQPPTSKVLVVGFYVLLGIGLLIAWFSHL